MNIPGATTKSEWETPQWLLQGVRDALRISRFSLDPATSEKNPTGASWAVYPPMDGLQTNWDDHHWLWLNPPWGKSSPIKPWVEKFQTFKGCGTMLVPANTGSRWFHLLFTAENRLAFFKGRVNYVDPSTGLEVKGCPFDSCLVLRNWSASQVGNLVDHLNVSIVSPIEWWKTTTL